MIQDRRSKKVILVSHCLLNQNSVVYGLAKRPSMVKELIDLLHELNIGIVQLPCPETLHLGLRRFWQVREQYDTQGFRELCREVLKYVITYVREYVVNGYEVVGIIGVTGSPSCGIHHTSSGDWVGNPLNATELRRIRGMGVFMEELLNTLRASGLISKLRRFRLLEFDYNKPQESLEKIKKELSSP
ncbi:MAG TPA: DUF523 domain-containing protein [Acidilobales archaeon]|nr:MAG: hypothetical protein B6U85_10350 [Desulfurococcales archaeon ex4484_42]RLG86323.1 MAG: hypothetical protein DRO18_04530 [Thermoprotei archaeon]HDD26638.1 DUF523 domain-containing protein [Acidilobales archaeon]